MSWAVGQMAELDLGGNGGSESGSNMRKMVVHHGQRGGYQVIQAERGGKVLNRKGKVWGEMSSRLERGWWEEGKRGLEEGVVMGAVLEACLWRTLHWTECSWLQSHLWINVFIPDCRTSNVLDCGTAGCFVTDTCQVRNMLPFRWQWWWINHNRPMGWISHSCSGIYNTCRVWAMSIWECVGRDHNQEGCRGEAASWGPKPPVSQWEMEYWGLNLWLVLW